MKYQRQAKILELVEKYDIETQDDLLEKLKDRDFRQHRQLFPEIFGK